jgi:methionine-rich copper-binding protein CopC
VIVHARRIALLLALFLEVAAWPWPGAAHSLPTRFDPRENAALPAGPVEIRIVFDGDLEPAFSGIEVTDADGRRVDNRDARVDGKNRRLLRVGLGAMGPGVYRVSWKILAIDGHRAEGTYVFTVGPR